MSVCIAWTKNNKSYLIADTLASSTQNITLSKTTSFLQRKETRDGYYVEESCLKIFQISEDFAIAVAGDVPSYYEVIEWIYTLSEYNSIHRILDLLQENFQHLLPNIEMIFLYKENQHNKIFVWDGKTLYHPTDPTIPIFIGSGAQNSKFVKAMKESICSNKDDDANMYLAFLISFAQCLSMKLKTIRLGFGGTFYGLFLSSKIQWMRDLEYVLLDNNGSVSQSISVIARKSSIMLSSSIEGTTRIFANNFLYSEWFSEYHNVRSIIKAVDTKEAFYYIFFGLKSNRIYLWEAKGILIRDDFRKWIRRDEKKVDYLYAIDPDVSSLIIYGKHKNLEPQACILHTIGSTYLPFNKICTSALEQLHNIKVLIGYDFDFVSLDCTTFNKEHIKLIRKNIFDFYNIVVIDYDFFCQKILKNNIDFYNTYDFDLTHMYLDNLLSHCLQNDLGVEYSKIKIIVIKDSHDEIINNINITSWFKTYHNCSFIITETKEKDMAELLIYWIKEYYINEKYFHLGQNVLIADNKTLGEILELLVPLGRRHLSNADWILVRMNNDETSMPGDFNYVNDEWAFLDVFKLDIGYNLQQSIAISEREQELLSGDGENVIHDWIDNNSLFNNVTVIDPTKTL